MTNSPIQLTMSGDSVVISYANGALSIPLDVIQRARVLRHKDGDAWVLKITGCTGASGAAVAFQALPPDAAAVVLQFMDFVAEQRATRAEVPPHKKTFAVRVPYKGFTTVAEGEGRVIALLRQYDAILVPPFPITLESTLGISIRAKDVDAAHMAANELASKLLEEGVWQPSEEDDA